MRTLWYTGTVHERTFSAKDIKQAWDIDVKDDIFVNARVSKELTVTNKLADKLIETGEFILFAEVADEPVLRPNIPVQVPESAAPDSNKDAGNDDSPPPLA